MGSLSLPPQRNKKTSEAEIEAMINKGGDVAKTASPDIDNDEQIKHINARLTAGVIRRIDALRAARPRKMGSPKVGVSLRDWIAEAVLEKLEREEKKKK